LVTQGLRYDIDFTGGTLVQVRFEQKPDIGKIRAALEKIQLGESIIQEFGDTREYIIRSPLTSSSSQEVAKKVQDALSSDPSLGKAEIRRVEFVGPQVGKELQLQAVYAVFFGLIGILLYIAIRFDGDPVVPRRPGAPRFRLRPVPRGHHRHVFDDLCGGGARRGLDHLRGGPTTAR